MKNDFTMLVNRMNTEVIFSEIDTAVRQIRHGASSNGVDHLSVADPREGEFISFVRFF